MKTLQHLSPLIEAQTELEGLRELVAASAGAASTQKQVERAAREIAKAEAKVTRLRAELKKHGCKLPADTKELPSTAAELTAVKEALSVAYGKHSVARRELDTHMRRADAVRDAANKALDDAVSAAYKTQALAAHPDKRRGAGSTHEDTMAFQRLQTAYATLRDAEMRRAYIDTFDHGAAAVLFTMRRCSADSPPPFAFRQRSSWGSRQPPPPPPPPPSRARRGAKTPARRCASAAAAPTAARAPW